MCQAWHWSVLRQFLNRGDDPLALSWTMDPLATIPPIPGAGAATGPVHDNGAMVASLGAQMVLQGRAPSDLALPADSSMPVTLVQA